jgi:hypothetical protein
MKKDIVEFPGYSIDDDGKVYKDDVEIVHTLDSVTNHVFVKIDTFLIQAFIPVYKIVSQYHLENPHDYTSVLFKNSIFNDVSATNLEFVHDDYEEKKE